MFEQLRYLDTDEHIREAIAILEGWKPEITPDDIFSHTSKLESPERGRYLASFDRLLNLLWCIAYARLKLGTITWDELGGFGWYLWRVRSTPAVARYSQENGYPEIITATDQLSQVEKWDESDARNPFIERPTDGKA